VRFDWVGVDGGSKSGGKPLALRMKLGARAFPKIDDENWMILSPRQGH